VHLSVMLLAITDSRVPQRALRSEGFGCSITAARRQAGGVAAAKLVKAARTAKKRVEACMVTIWWVGIGLKLKRVSRSENAVICGDLEGLIL
jgi:hypothetical protein